ncbi:unnamed protein product [Boreogadus saida]
MDFWENIPSRKEQEAVLGRTRRAVSSRPELEDALPEWAVELLSPTAFWPESYMPVPPDFGDRPKPPRSRSQPLPPAPRYQPLPPAPRYPPLPPVPRYQPLSPAPSYHPLSPAPSYQPLPPVPSYQLLPPVPSYQPPPLRTIRVGVRGTGLFACLRWSALQTIQGRHALRSCLRGPAPCSFQRGTGLCSCRRGPALQTVQGRHAPPLLLVGALLHSFPRGVPLQGHSSRGDPPSYLSFLQRGPAPIPLLPPEGTRPPTRSFLQRDPPLYRSFLQRGPALYLSFLQRGPGLYLSFLQRGPALHRAFLLRDPPLYLTFAGLLKGSAFPLPLLAPQAVRLMLPAMPWGSFLAARLTSLSSAPLFLVVFVT